MVTFPYLLKRERRSSLKIAIEEDGEVLVTAPQHMSVDLIEAYLKKKERWVTKRRGEHLERIARWKAHTFRAGDEIMIFGRPHVLSYADSDAAVAVEEDELLVRDDIAPGEPTKEAVEKFLKAKARRYFKKAVEEYSSRMKTEASRVWLSSAKRRWGSCNNKNGLNVNWRLVMAPKSVIHSVIVHELAHTIRKDHSPAFWDIVYKHFPNYKRAKKWLKENELMLRWD